GPHPAGAVLEREAGLDGIGHGHPARRRDRGDGGTEAEEPGLPGGEALRRRPERRRPERRRAPIREGAQVLELEPGGAGGDEAGGFAEGDEDGDGVRFGSRGHRGPKVPLLYALWCKRAWSLSGTKGKDRAPEDHLRLRSPACSG